MGTFNYLQMRNIFSLIVVKDWRRRKRLLRRRPLQRTIIHTSRAKEAIIITRRIYLAISNMINKV
jgi:hypothetical protein